MEMMSQERKTVKEIFPTVNGIFTHILYEFPEFINKSLMDMEFVVSYGLRWVSPLVEHVLDRDDMLSLLADVITMKYKVKWDRQIAVYSLQYDPLYNYSDKFTESSTTGNDFTRTDNESGSSTDTRTDNLSNQRTLNTTDTRTDNLSNNNTRTLNTTDTSNSTGHDKYQGFNSSEYLPVSSQDSNGSVKNTGTITDANIATGTVTNANTGTVSDLATGTQSHQITHSRLNERTESDNETVTRESKHLGNIGNITNQSIILEEIELWRWNFIQELYDDVKKELTLSIY